MLTVHHAPNTRSVRVIWLLEELGVPYGCRKLDCRPPAQGFFSQDTPLGKFPVIEDGEVVIAESGAIVQYLLERHGEGRLEPAVGSPLRGPFLMWIHHSEGTLYPPLEAERYPELVGYLERLEQRPAFQRAAEA